jgi:hypothetical protein
LKEKLMAVGNVIDHATDVSKHDGRWRDFLARDWVATGKLIKMDTLNAMEGIGWMAIRDQGMKTGRRFQF